MVGCHFSGSPFGKPLVGSGAPSGVPGSQQVDPYAQAVPVVDTAAVQRFYTPETGSWSRQQMIVDPNQPFAQYVAPVPLPPRGPVLHQDYVATAGPVYGSHGYPLVVRLQHYVEQVVRSAYYQGLAHAFSNFSSATQLSGGGSRAGPVVPRQAYQHDAFSGVVLGREVVALGGKCASPAWDGRHNSFPHSVVVRESYADCGYKHLWKVAPEWNAEEAVHFHAPSR